MQQIAEQLLDRALLPKDGIAKTLIENTEQRLGFALPQALRNFYLKTGNNQRFSQAFNHFLMPDDLTVEHGKLIFLAENQHVCWWAIAISELQNAFITVYQTTDDQTTIDSDFYNEGVDLTEFIRINLYYQLAQGGYQFCGDIQVEETHKFAQVLQLLTTDDAWQKVVVHNGLIIYANGCQLIWYFTNQDGDIFETIFASTLHKKDLTTLIKNYQFNDLG